METEIINPQLLETYEIIESYNQIIREEKELTLRKNCLRRELDARIKDKPYLDLNYYAELKAIPQFRLDTDKVKAYLGARVKEFEKEVINYRLNIKRNK